MFSNVLPRLIVYLQKPFGLTARASGEIDRLDP